MDKHTVVHPCNEILSNKKDWTPDTLNDCAKWKKQNPKAIYGVIPYMTFVKRQKR